MLLMLSSWFQFKQNLLKTFTAKSDKYGLSSLTYTSFNCNFGFRHKYCAADVVKCLQAVLEHHDNVEDMERGDKPEKMLFVSLCEEPLDSNPAILTFGDT